MSRPGDRRRSFFFESLTCREQAVICPPGGSVRSVKKLTEPSCRVNENLVLAFDELHIFYWVPIAYDPCFASCFSLYFHHNSVVYRSFVLEYEYNISVRNVLLEKVS
jgi:hypothetical protein